MKGKIALLTAVLSLATAATVNATNYTFSDNHIYWPGWNNGTSEDYEDVIGIPNFSGGTVSVDALNNLTSLTFNYTGGYNSNWSNLVPGDVFIDLNADSTWDLVVSLGTATAGIVGIYDYTSSPIALGSDSYITANEANKRDGTPWGGANVRDGHPFRLENPDATKLTGSATYSGWTDPTVFPTSGSFTLSNLTLNGLPITLGEGGFDIIIGLTVNCSNDVIYERVQGAPVPEPASMFLLGTALLAGGSLRRRK